MLLSLLSRKDKLKFLDLAMHIVSVDGDPTDVETRLLNMLLAEVGDNIIKEYTFTMSSDLEETIVYFVDASPHVQNIVYLNLLKITMEDEFYNTEEHFFLESIRQRFSMTEQKKKQLMKIVYQERDLKEEAKRVVKS